MPFHLKTVAGAALASISTLALVAGPARAEPAATPPVATAPEPAHPYGPSGLDIAARDLAVKPGDDFQLHATGKWLATHEIPADKPSISTGYEAFERAQLRTRDIIMSAPTTGGHGALFASFMDEAALEKLGARPLMADVAKIRAVPDKSAMARLMGGTQGRFGSSIVGGGVLPDLENPTMNIFGIGASGLGLPDRDYYLEAKFQPQRDAYAAFIERTLALVGEPDPKAGAAAIMAFETEMAKVRWTAAQRRDIVKLKNFMSSDQLAAYAPGFDWSAWFAGAGVKPQARMLVGENTAVRDIARLYAETPLATIKAWQVFHTADQASPYLSKTFVDNRFEFTKTLSGVSVIQPRWKRGVDFVNGAVGEMVGRDYAARHFPAEAKSRMVALVGNLKAAMADRIRSNDWMSPTTKTAALEKLAKMDVMVGYPDQWRSWNGLVLKPDDLYGNVQRAGAFNVAYQMAELGKPVDRKRWAMTPQTVNAYNGLLENKIVFPAGILQAPFFSLSADDAINYGAIGSIIGHEISHGFDDQGRKVDSTGAVRDWWGKDDAERFEARSKVFGDQYAKFEVVPGTFINPALTMGENIADYAGLLVALDAYHKSLNGKPAPVIEGLTGDQRFFLAFAQSWRGKTRPDTEKRLVASDPHSPTRFRVIGPVRNIEAWYAAFGVKPGDTMYIPPEQRAHIW